MKILATLLMLCCAKASLAAQPACRDFSFEDKSFTSCTVSADADLRLFHTDSNDQIYGSFAKIEQDLASHGERLGFAMNAGMYHPDRSPVGLYIQDNTERSAVADGGGFGNFGLTPNGVFCISTSGFAVVETQAYRAAPPSCVFASQSGPLLVINGALHPKFQADSTSTFIRNGVGVSADGQTATFVISNTAVNFDTFARAFRDHLHLDNALFFDGKVSRLYAPALGRADIGRPLGVIVGLILPR